MKIEQLNTLAQRLDGIGKQHLGLDAQGRTVPTTSSLGGRFVNWVRSRHSDAAAQANRDMIARVISTVRDTEGMGDSFADMVRQRLADKLAAGRPLSGREAARVLQDMIHIKTSEDAARLENRLLSARDLFAHCNTPAAGGPSALENVLAARRQRFGLPDATPAQLQAYRDAALRDLEGAARRADHSLTEAEGLDRLNELARRMSLEEAKAGIAAMADQVCGDGPDGFMAHLEQAMRGKGITGTVSPATREMLARTIHDKLSNRCLLDSNNMHQPTAAEAATVAGKVVDDFVAALETVVHARAMPQDGKPILLDEILHAAAPVTAGMAQAMCESVLDTGQFVRSLTRGHADLAELRTAFNSYAARLHNAITQPDGSLRPGIAGSPEADTVRDLTARAACKFLGLGSHPLSPADQAAVTEARKHHQPLTEELARRLEPREKAVTAANTAAQRALEGGSPLHALRYELGQEADHGVRTRNELLLANVLGALAQATESSNYDHFIATPPGLGQMPLAQARRFVPQGQGLPGGQSLDVTAARQQLADGLNQTVDSTPPDSEMTDWLARVRETSPGLADKVSCFSGQFLKDFVRSGISVNGQPLGAGGTIDDLPGLERQLDELIALFPSIEEAGRVCSPLHQACGADILLLLMGDPATAEEALRIHSLQGRTLSDRLAIDVMPHRDGSYRISIEYDSQKVDPTLGPGASSGFNVRATFSLDNGQAPLHFRAEDDFDVLFNTTRPR